MPPGVPFPRHTCTLIAKYGPPLNRAALSPVVRTSRLAQTRWGLKDMSARVALHMHREGVTPLARTQAPRTEETYRALARDRAAVAVRAPDASGGGTPATHRARRYPRRGTAVERLYHPRNHYLGHHPLPGAQMRYFVRATNGAPLAVLGFAAAWKAAPRDAFIGWSPEARCNSSSVMYMEISPGVTTGCAPKRHRVRIAPGAGPMFRLWARRIKSAGLPDAPARIRPGQRQCSARKAIRSWPTSAGLSSMAK